MKERPAFLVVDDEEMMRTVISEFLADFGCDVQSYARGKDALAWFEVHHERTQLVILDLSLPDLQGEKALSRLKIIDATVPVVLISGSDIKRKREALIEAGACAILQKPFRAMQLRSIVEPLLVN